MVADVVCATAWLEEVSRAAAPGNDVMKFRRRGESDMPTIIRLATISVVGFMLRARRVRTLNLGGKANGTDVPVSL
jgi:hypothetical protein